MVPSMTQPGPATRGLLDRRLCWVVLTIASLAATFGSVSSSAEAGTKIRPPTNFVLLMSDDQGWGEVAHADHSRLQTPTLDDMAAAGLRFERFYAAAPICSPTRASVMTGRHPNRSGVLSRNYALRPEEITLPALLRQAGYRTAHFGKWHLGPVKADSPVNPGAFGFDAYLSADRAFNIDDVLNRNGTRPIVFSGEGSEIIVQEAIHFMLDARAEGRPFFVVIWFGSPHQPYQGISKDLFRYGGGFGELAKRYAEITAMDRAIGRVRHALRKLKVADNTLVWFCSDNGPPRHVEENGGLRGHKGDLYEGGIRVPGIVEWPGVVAKGRVAASPAVTTDIFATILDVAGIAPPDRPLDGVSLKPLLEGREGVRAPIGFWQYPAATEHGNPLWLSEADLLGVAHPRSPRVPARFYNFRHPVPKTDDFRGGAVWMDGRWKLLLLNPATDGAPVRSELFDLSRDAAERDDVSAGNPAVVARMRRELDAWRRDVEHSLSGRDYDSAPALERSRTSVNPPPQPGR